MWYSVQNGESQDKRMIFQWEHSGWCRGVMQILGILAVDAEI